MHGNARGMSCRLELVDNWLIEVQGVFCGLPDWLREGRKNPVASKKRRQSSNNSPVPQAARSHPDVSAAVREAQPGAQRRTNTFPKQNSGMSSNPTPGFDQRLAFAGPSQPSGASSGPYTPTSSQFSQVPFLGGSVETSPNELLGNLPLDLGNPNLPDLSAMMFPSSEPFNYPNQPLTTFENNQFGKDQAFFSSLSNTNAAQMMSSRQGSNVDSDNLEAQFYTLPPYMMQQQQQQQPQQQQTSWNMGMSAPQAQHQHGPQSQPQQHQQMNGMRQFSGQFGMDGGTSLAGNESWTGRSRGMAPNQFPGINLNDIFGGEEWNGLLMDQGYR